MTILILIALLLIGGLALSHYAIRHLFDDVKTPLVEPAPDVFPLHYHSPYVSGYRHTQRDNQGNWIAGYQPPSTPHSNPPHSHSVICQCDTCMGRDATLLPQLDLRLATCTCGDSPAFCQERRCRQHREELYQQGEITEQEAYPERAFLQCDMPEPMVIECEELRYD